MTWSRRWACRASPRARCHGYRQWQDQGCQVRKGEKSSLVVFYKTLQFEQQNEQSGELENGERMVADLVDNVFKQLSATAAKRRVVLTRNNDAGLNACGETGFLALALRNVIENALLHSPKSETVAVQTFRRNGQIVLEVSDRGSGMRDEDIPHATERFFRSRDNVSTGSGLGLAIVQTAMERSNGSVAIRNREGGGLSVLLTLPEASVPL